VGQKVFVLPNMTAKSLSSTDMNSSLKVLFIYQKLLQLQWQYCEGRGVVDYDTCRW
jgi:hypothetical protein